MKLKDNVAVVTGAGRGIGKSIAEALAKEGANLVIADVGFDQAKETADELQKSFSIKAIAVKLDVSKSEEVKKTFDEANRTFGKIDILVNNAGITRDGFMIKMDESDWDSVIDVNLKGVFLCSKEAVKIMMKQKYGRIVNIASIVAFTGNPGQANYSASKAGIVGLTKTIAKEYASRGITSNAVAPGFIKTAMTDALAENIKEEMKKSIPLGKFGTSEDVANSVVFLVSPQAGYITGQVIHVNGGMYM